MEREAIEQAVRQAAASAEAGRLSCAHALSLARKLDTETAEIGGAANRNDLRIVDCQLGCFEIAKATHDDLADYQPPAAIAEEIAASLVEGHLPCPVAFEVSRKLKLTPRQVGDAATKLDTKISRCQLGCFP
ncbi:MAG: hypothetical protein V3S10_03785 [Dehalococcoidales bacterium]